MIRSGPTSLRLAAMRLAAVLVAAGLFRIDPVAAQSCHTLTGRWTLNLAASRIGKPLIFNPFYHVDTIELEMRQRADGVEQNWRFKGIHVDEASSYAIPTDGRSRSTGARSQIGIAPVDVRGEWQNCTLVVHAHVDMFGQKIPTENSYVVSSDDRQLDIRQISHSDLGDMDRNLVFDRVAPEAPQ